MPTYDFRCPNGHTFELFQRMSDPPPDGCDVCGATPVERLLSPVAVHFKGSGFYSTDYGRGAKKKDDGAKDGETSTTAADKPKESDKKPAPAASSDTSQ
jgi:putative FmdB family regulatory protein